MSLIEGWLLAIMQCPRCEGGLVEDEAESRLRCEACAATYPVTDGIPDMIVTD